MSLSSLSSSSSSSSSLLQLMIPRIRMSSTMRTIHSTASASATTTSAALLLQQRRATATGFHCFLSSARISRSRSRSFSSTAAAAAVSSLSSSSSSSSSSKEEDDNNNNNNISNSSPYFQKVLIANRGEISIRIARTCRRLKIPTVAVFANNDSSSKHIQEADESVCLGESYLDTPRILQAIRDTGADAVHPGYGFMSENAEFANTIQELEITTTTTSDNDNNNNNNNKKVAWLGPSAQAIRDMGDKLQSKEIAKKAGVAIIPGGEGHHAALKSVEDALEIIHGKKNNNNNNNSNNELRYPVLLKAAAGGGGKGMRVCYNDQELVEGYPLAQSEGLKFFKDDRLLLEQYLENPHHIEFQVVCCTKNSATSSSSTTTTDVAIFAERECSIQRRNQKVVEESPSCLLSDETRRQMMEQTALLCQSVGYEGAGTLEWLVVNSDDDDDPKYTTGQQQKQKFYFLEMNTRLQVEHPVTEAVSYNVDLVEAMLRVGSGQGLPPEWYDSAEIVDTTCSSNGNGNGNNEGGKMLIMPWKGHSIEARIYAEDPLRGYLPSMGPLVPYKEPKNAIMVDDGVRSSNSGGCGGGDDKYNYGNGYVDESYLRLDSGVVEGHVVTPFYDPMLSKIISYAPTRDEAIQVLSDGLDSYVIEGVQHNARLVNAVLRHPSFRAGDTPTSFLKTHISDFNDYLEELLTDSEEEELAVAVALISKSRENIFGRPPVVGSSVNDGSGKTVVVVRLDGLFGNGDAFSVTLVEGGHKSNTAYVSRLKDNGDIDDNENEKRAVIIDSLHFDMEYYLAHVTLDGTDRTIQVLKEDQSGTLKVQMHGAEYTQCLVQSPREYELSKYMRPPIIEDTSDLVMSPMPGTLISFAGVQEGDHVVTGQELCVVEAMKMQNIIRSPREGIIAKLNVETGAALVTDQVLMEFETNDEDENLVA